MHPTTSFSRGPEEDFVVFRRHAVSRAFPSLFLTYKGVDRLMNVSKAPAARCFCDWAASMLQAAQMGSPEQRQQAAALILGVPLAKVRDVPSCLTARPTSVYLMSVGTVAQLHKSMEIATYIADSDLVLKWGESKDLDDRCRKHLLDLGRIRGATVELVKFIYIDSLRPARPPWPTTSETLGGSCDHPATRCFRGDRSDLDRGAQRSIDQKRMFYEERLARKDDAIRHKTEILAEKESMIAE
ncbi:hypothetical protein HDU89_006494 [Geranomyces variabilis]|nr:hypothetical protein HDU89_006494 [Geranomyces variabilis]